MWEDDSRDRKGAWVHVWESVVAVIHKKVSDEHAQWNRVKQEK